MIAPMLSKLREQLPQDRDYYYEVKLDGQRTIAEVSRSGLLLYTRSFQNVTERYPELNVLRKSLHAKSAVLDGEIVALKDGVPSFELMQQRMALRDLRKLAHVMEQVPILYYVFDILEIDGKSTLKKPLRERKKLLEKTVKSGPLVKILPYFESREIVDKARDYGYEGVVLKKKESHYLPGLRTDFWIKHKFVQQDTFFLCGWMEGKRGGYFGAVLLGKRKGKDLLYAGRAGTGFNEKTLGQLQTLFKKHEASKPPFNKVPSFPETVHWLVPKLKARIKFTEWTNAGLLRNPVYLGLE